MRKFLILLVLAILSISCGGESESENGVARAEDAEPVPAKVDTVQQVSQSPVEAASGTTGSDTGSPAPTAASISQAAITKTDEDLTSEFAACLRNQGFDVPDPEVTADGSVDLRAFFTKLNQDPNFNRQNPETREALSECRGLLADASFAQPRSSEDEIELQDQILSFAACLRDQGVAVADPDFSQSTRGALRTIFAGQEIDREDPDVAEAIAECRESSFTSGMRGNGGNRR